MTISYAFDRAATRLRPLRDRTALVRTLGDRRSLPRRQRRSAPAVLLPDHASLHQRRPAHRSLVRDGAVGCGRSLASDAGQECVVPAGLRRLRSAGRKRGDQQQHPSQTVDVQQRREHDAPAQDNGRVVRLASRGRHLGSRVLPLDTVVVSQALRARPGLSSRSGLQFLSGLWNCARE